MRQEIDLSKRKLFKLLMLESAILLALKTFPGRSKPPPEFEDEFVVINGWVLLKEDFR